MNVGKFSYIVTVISCLPRPVCEARWPCCKFVVEPEGEFHRVQVAVGGDGPRILHPEKWIVHPHRMLRSRHRGSECAPRGWLYRLLHPVLLGAKVTLPFLRLCAPRARVDLYARLARVVLTHRFVAVRVKREPVEQVGPRGQCPCVPILCVGGKQ